MNACINCGECVDTGCLCTAHVAPIKASIPSHTAGKCGPDEADDGEPLTGWEIVIFWTSILVIGVGGLTLIATGLSYFYQAAFNFYQTFFN